MLVLVTGGTGFLGSHLIRALLKENFLVRTLIRETSRCDALDGIGVEFCTGDLRNPQSLERAVEGVKVIFHCAALVTDWAPKKDFIEVNVEGTHNLLEAATRAGVEKFIHVSTNDVFGISGKRLIKTGCSYVQTGFPYPDTKTEAERLVFLYHREGKILASVIYPVWIFGPGDRTLVPEIVHALRSRQMILIGGGRSPIHLSYVENVAQAMILMSRKEEALGEGFFVFDGKALTWREFVWKLADSLGMSRPRLSLPPKLAYGIAAVLEAIYTSLRIRKRPVLTRYIVRILSNDLRYDGSRIYSLFGYRPRFSLNEGFEKSFDWLKKNRRELMKTK